MLNFGYRIHATVKEKKKKGGPYPRTVRRKQGKKEARETGVSLAGVLYGTRSMRNPQEGLLAPSGRCCVP